MKTPEDEAFDELARKQGAWGGGFPAKRKMAADKINFDFDEEYKKMHEDCIKYGTLWEKDGERIDPMSVYKEPVTEREALKLALEALEELNNTNSHWWQEVDRATIDKIDPAIIAIKAALAQPAQERCCYHDSDCAVHNMPAYPAGPCDCTQQFKFWSVTGKYERQAFACLSNAEAYCKGLNATYPEGNYIVSPLYTTPPQREWVGLTEDEWSNLKCKSVEDVWIALTVQAKLKEKNF